MKTSTNSGDFTGRRIRFKLWRAAAQRELESSINSLKKQTDSHMSVILKSNTETRFKNC
jgi:hypothetical protein